MRNDVMSSAQRLAHIRTALDCAINSRASIAAELAERRTAYERSVRDRGATGGTGFGHPSVAQRAHDRIQKLVPALAAAESRVKGLEQEIQELSNV